MSDPVVVQPTPETTPAPTPNPVIKPADEDSLNLKRMSEEADRGNFGQTEEAPSTTEKTETETVAKTGEVQRDEQGRFVKADGTKSAPNEAAPTTDKAPDKPESEFSKKQKEEARRQKTWQGLQEERAEIARDRAAVQAERERVAQERAQRVAEPAPQKFSSQQYHKIADEFSAEGKAHKAAGNHEEAAESYSLASEARAAARGVEQQEQKDAGTRQQTEFQKTFGTNAAAFAKEVPDVQNPESEISRELVKLFDEEPMLNFHPDGVRKGYELLQLRKAGDENVSLKAKVAELQTELNRLRGITEVSGAPPTGQTSKKTFDQLLAQDVNKAADRLGEMAERADAA